MSYQFSICRKTNIIAL